MKKILFLLLFITGFLQAQTLQNPTFGNTTTNTLKVKAPETVTSANFLTAFGIDEISLNKIDPVNLPLATSTINAINTATSGLDNKISKGLISGDSTIASYLGQNSVASYLVDSKDVSAGNSITDISVPGNTIAQQKTAYLALSDKNTYDYVIVQIGLNDVGFTETNSAVIARLQDYINTINSNKKSSCKIIIGTMTPARQRWFDSYGSTNGAIAQAQWEAINTAIMSTVTGVDFRQQNHTVMLNDGLNNLAGIYDMGDYIHENNAARQIIASEYRKTLNGINFLKINTSLISSKYEYKGIKSYGTISLPNNVAGIGFNAYSDGTQPRFINNGYAFFMNSGVDDSFKFAVTNNNNSGYGAIPTIKDVIRYNTVGVFVKDILAVGTDTPTTFPNFGSLHLNGYAGSIIEFKTGDVFKSYISSDINSLDIYNGDATPINFITNTNLRGSFSSAGVFRINNLSGTGTRNVNVDNSGNLISGGLDSENVKTIGDQNISGVKKFTSNTQNDGYILFTSSVPLSTTVPSIGRYNNRLLFSGLGNSENRFTLTANSTPATVFDYIMPDSSGKLALLSDVIGAVTLSNTSASTLTLSVSSNQLVTYYVFGGTTATWTLPVPAGNTGKKLALINTGTGTVTVNTNGSLNVIYNSGATTNTYSLLMGVNVELISDGSKWIVL